MDPQTSSYDATFVFEFTWTDDRLSWSESQYPVGYVFLHASDIWFPDLGVFQMIGDADSSLSVASKRAKVHSNGLVTITFSSMVSSICGVSGLSYPRDGHYCHLTLEYQKERFILIATSQPPADNVKMNKSVENSYTKTLFQLNIKRFTYSFLTNEFNPHWVLVEDPCKDAMIEKYGIHQGIGFPGRYVNS